MKKETELSYGLPEALIRQMKEETVFEVNAAPINTSFVCTINEEFRHVRQFADLVNVLDGAIEGDYVEIQLSTDGGALHSILPLLTAMKNTQAHVHVAAVSDVSSAGTLLMMQADSVTINEYVTLMFHTVQYGYSNHGGNMQAYVEHTTVMNNRLLRDMYTGFLTEQEILRLMDGKEIYMTGEECIKRLKNRDVVKEAIAIAKQASKKKVKNKQQQQTEKEEVV